MTGKKKALYAAVAAAALLVASKVAASYGHPIDEELLRAARQIVDLALELLAP